MGKKKNANHKAVLGARVRELAKMRDAAIKACDHRNLRAAKMSEEWAAQVDELAKINIGAAKHLVGIAWVVAPKETIFDRVAERKLTELSSIATIVLG